MSPKTVHLIAAARPNFMKVAPLYHALSAESWCVPRIIHTGQHYDANMSDAFFRDLRLPEPAHHLEIGSGTHAEQTGRTMIAYEAVCTGERPDAIVVVGDVNATAACALVGAKLWIPVVHLEAGLRSRDRRMPEEINRLVTDQVGGRRRPVVIGREAEPGNLGRVPEAAVGHHPSDAAHHQACDQD